MKKICIVTATRSEYGLLRWLIDEVKNDENLLLQLVVTGTHLSPEFGLTYKEIEKDGYQIDEKVEIIMSSSTQEGVVKTMGVCSLGFADVFNRLRPDVIVVLGDRYELLPICGAALVMNIPIAHIAGGDITDGAIDNQIRNAITMMATLHFPGTNFSAERIKRMIGIEENVFVTGETNLDNFIKLEKITKEEIALKLNVSIDKPWILMTYHPETNKNLEYNLNTLQNILYLFSDLGDNFEFIVTGANSDFGGSQINMLLEEYCRNNSNTHFFTSLGQLIYVNILPHLYCMMGNSSSGIFETPFWKIPSINIGERQNGRQMCCNIISTKVDFESIKASFELLSIPDFKKNLQYVENFYGDGHSSERIKCEIKKYLYGK